MYYNIKIKSSGSEFSLESNDKEIAQNEMDKYFASIFDVSADFKANIKKTVITRKNIKSISDFENLNQNTRSQETIHKPEIKEVNISQEKIEALAMAKAQELIRKEQENRLEKEKLEQELKAQFEAQKNRELEELKIQKANELKKLEMQQALQLKELETLKREKEELLVSNANIQKELKETLIAQTKEIPLESNPTGTISVKSNNIEPIINKSIITERNISESNIDTPIQIESFDPIFDEEPDEEPQPTSVIKFQNEAPNIEVPKTPEIQVLDTKETTEINKPKEKALLQNETNETEIIMDDSQSEINELISLAQQRIDSLGTDNSQEKIIQQPQEIKPIIKNNPIKIEPKQQEIETQNNLNSIFNLQQNEVVQQTEPISVQSQPTISIEATQPTISIETPKESKEIETPQPTIIVETPQPEDDEIENSPEISLAEIEISLQSQMQEVNISAQETPPETTQIQPNTNTIEYNTEGNYLPDDENEIKEEITPQAQTTLDFKPFLASFGCKELTDEFIICAYFIKNVLKQNEFTIKFINSKLFQATGKIADMSIIDELVSKEYINVIETDETKRYSISSDGEAYFASLLQG